MSAVVLLLLGITIFTETRAPAVLLILELVALVPCLAVDLAVLFGPRHRDAGDLLAPLDTEADHSDNPAGPEPEQE